MKPKYVLIVCALIFSGIMTWDATLYMDNIPGNSITQVVVALSKNYPLIPAFIGFLFGGLMFHFFDTTNQK